MRQTLGSGLCLTQYRAIGLPRLRVKVGRDVVRMGLIKGVRLGGPGMGYGWVGVLGKWVGSCG